MEDFIKRLLTKEEDDKIKLDRFKKMCEEATNLSLVLSYEEHCAALMKSDLERRAIVIMRDEVLKRMEK